MKKKKNEKKIIMILFYFMFIFVGKSISLNLLRGLHNLVIIEKAK